MDSIASAEEWIDSRLIGPDSYFSASGFEAMIVVYRVHLRGSFLASLINGTQAVANFCAPEGRYRYNELVRQIAELTERESAFWFYSTDPDNCSCVINWVRECDYDNALDEALFLETELA